MGEKVLTSNDPMVAMVVTAAEDTQATRVGADGGAEIVQGASIGGVVEKLLVVSRILLRAAEVVVEVFAESFDVRKRMEPCSTRDTFFHFANGDASTS
jgi:hypothetical protein